MHAFVTAINPLSSIYRKRVLPVPGVVRVHKGQKVSALDVVAEAQVPSRHFIVDVFSAFHCRTTVDAERMILRKPGETLESDDIIAETSGLFRRILRTPAPGRVVSIKAGRVLIEADHNVLQVFAGLDGVVSEVHAEYGATITTTAGIVQGVWGNKRISTGELFYADDLARGELSLELVGSANCGKMVAGDYCTSSDTLMQAAASGIGGLILGGMDSGLIPVAEAQPYPILVIAGFGRLELDQVSRRLLQDLSGRQACLDTCEWNKVTGERPVLAIPQDGEGAVVALQQELSEGKWVRVHAGEHAGKLGSLLTVHPGFTPLPNGIRTATADVKLMDGKQVLVPLKNLDIIELGQMVPSAEE